MAPKALAQTDPILVPFLESGDEAECDRLLNHLTCETAEPVIRRVIRNKLGSIGYHGAANQQSDAEDLHGNAVMKLIARLREIKAASYDSPPITNLANYAAAVAFNVWNEHLRRKYPLRNKLKNRLRYLFTHSPEFVLWEGLDQEQLCGLRSWKRQQREPVADADVRRLSQDIWALERAGLLAASERTDIQKVTLAVLKFLRGPAELDDLVGVVAEIMGVKDIPAGQHPNDTEGSVEDAFANPDRAFDKAVECRLYLERLWEEICQLPLRQRIALLLNLKDAQGENGLELFSLTGVANIRDIAQAIEMPINELDKIWNELPLEDSAIASRLDVTRQQVINLRKCSRERLARRTKEK